MVYKEVSLDLYIEKYKGWTIMDSLKNTLFESQEDIPDLLPFYKKREFLIKGVEKAYSLYVVRYPYYISLHNRVDFFDLRWSVMLLIHRVEHSLINRSFGHVIKPYIRHINVYYKRGEVLVVLELQHPVKLGRGLFSFDGKQSLPILSFTGYWDLLDHQEFIALDWSLLFKIKSDERFLSVLKI